MTTRFGGLGRLEQALGLADKKDDVKDSHVLVLLWLCDSDILIVILNSIFIVPCSLFFIFLFTMHTLQSHILGLSRGEKNRRKSSVILWITTIITLTFSSTKRHKEQRQTQTLAAHPHCSQIYQRKEEVYGRLSS
ncbi:hypothetical protein BKA57DRAFT_18652 [Linnemannia elongata]|nr:hypothetical protein BKA57DRAFT_18652 [Linnemannia elongata]